MLYRARIFTGAFLESTVRLIPPLDFYILESRTLLFNQTLKNFIHTPKWDLN